MSFQPLTDVIRPLALARSGGAVKRMHTKCTIQTQTVAAHSYGVAWFCWALTHGQPSANLLMAALAHDIAESELGDIPSPTKRKLSRVMLDNMETEILCKQGVPVFELTEYEQKVLKVADLLDLMNFCLDERRLGNLTLKSMLDNCMYYMVPELVDAVGPVALQLMINITGQYK